MNSGSVGRRPSGQDRVGVLSLAFCILFNLSCACMATPGEREGDTMLRENLRSHVECLTVRIGERNLWLREM